MKQYPNIKFILQCMKRWEVSFDEYIDSYYMYATELKDYLYDYMQDQIYLNSIRIFIKEVNIRKNEIDADGNKAYKDIDNEYSTNESLDKLFLKYPVLEEKVSVIINNEKKQIALFFQRLKEDAGILNATYNFKISKLSMIEFEQDSDSHNHGAKTMCISDGNNKILYKPHSLVSDVFLTELYANVSPYLKYSLEHPCSIDRGTYGWQEFIEKRLPENEEEWSRYYFRYGELLFFAYSINMTDIHSENLIQNGENPYVIDTETIFYNNSYSGKMDVQNRNNVPQVVFNDYMTNSVMNTLMLPFKAIGSPVDVDLSPLSVFANQESDSILNYKIVDEFSDNIRFEIVKYSSYKKHEHDPFLYTKEIAGGFEFSYQWYLDNEDYYINLVDKLLSKYTMPVRQVLRATYVYGKFLDAARHPDYLENKSKTEILFKKMISSHNKFRIWQGENEVKSLLESDFPYFYTYINDKAVYCIYGKCDNFFTQTIRDIINKRLMSLSLQDMELQKSLIFISMSTINKPNSIGYELENVKKMSDYTAVFFRKQEVVDEIIRYILSIAIWNQEKDLCMWAGQAEIGNSMKMCTLSHYLYDGGGIVLLLLYAAADNRGKYESIIRSAMNYFEIISEEDRKLSAYNGIGSMLYLYYELIKLWKDTVYQNRFEKLLNRVAAYSLSEDIPIDYCNGLSGMAVLLENIYLDMHDEKLIPIIIKYVDYCIDHIDTIKLAGLAHGYAGVSLATSGLYAITKNEKYRIATLELINEENKLFDLQEGNWKDLRFHEKQGDSYFWCHGAGGIALARMKAYQHLGESICLKDLNTAVIKLKKDMNKLKNHSLCHGMFGNLDILNSIYNSGIIDEDVLSKCDLLQLKNGIMENIISDGCVCGISNAYNMVSFMLGISGMAYSLLRMDDVHIPNFLLLEL